MSSAPQGYSTIGPIYELKTVKEKFIEVCKAEDKTMEQKLKELIKTAVKTTFPEFAFPDDTHAR
jgi:hypothetical protein